MRQYFFKFFSLLRKIAQKRFMYFVAAVVILVILADNYSEAHKRNLIIRETGLAVTAEKEPFVEMRRNEDTKVDSLVKFALSLEGVPYVYAGKNPEGFDCSGFIYYVYHRFGVEVPAGSANQYLIGEPIEETDIQKGDLVFFTGTQKGDRSVGHVGIVISDETMEGIEFVHSSSGGGGRGVTVNDLDHPHYKARFLGARRVIDAS